MISFLLRVRIISRLSACLLGLLALSQFDGRSAAAQTVQLPSVEIFSVGTTVVVPDRGSAYLGGVSRSAYGSNSAGLPGASKLPGVNRLFGNRGIGTSTQVSSARVTATIIDHEEIDRALLGDGAAAASPRIGDRLSRRTVAAPHDAAVAKKAAFISKNVARRRDVR